MSKLKPIRRVYGKPWSKIAKDVEISPSVLKSVGEIIAEEISKEARKDYLRKGKTPYGDPMGLPKTRRFFDSFNVDLVGPSTIGITTTWPWAERHIEGRSSFKMWWLTRTNGVYSVPITQPDGRVVIVATPPNLENAWIHPGALKFNFVSRGVKKGRVRAAKVLVAELKQQLLAGNPIR